MTTSKDFRAEWGEVDRSSSTASQTVSCIVGNVVAGALTLAVRNAWDEDGPVVGLSWASVEPGFRGGEVGVFLIQEVARTLSDARVVAGPLPDDEDAGPRYRLRCWVDAGVPVHEVGCAAAGSECDCLNWIRREVLVRLGRRRMLGGSSEDVPSSQEFRRAVVALGL